MRTVTSPTRSWEQQELEAVEATVELEIAVRRADGSLRRGTPVWVVRVGVEVFVRTWYRRSTGWFGAALDSGRARVRLPGLDTDVRVDDVGEDAPALGDEVDAAYRAKYGAGAASMVTPEAVTTTLRLVPLAG